LFSFFFFAVFSAPCASAYVLLVLLLCASPDNRVPPAQVAIQIGAEVNSQNAMLDSMSTGFDSAGGVLRTTMANLKSLAEGGSAGHLIILVVVVVVVLFVAAKFLR